MRKFSLLIFTLSLLFFFNVAEAQTKSADLVIINANIRTIDEKQPRAEAVAVTGNKILAIGTNREIRKLIGENTKTIDAGGRLVLPGFNDSHVHFLTTGNLFFSVNLRGVRTRAEIIEKIRRNVQYLPKGAWILGSGWDARNWSADDLPKREFIDEITPDNPVFIYGLDINSAFANSSALKIAGLFDGKKSIAGGKVFRDETGAPNGILKGKATFLVKNAVPKTAQTDKAAFAEAASNYAAAFGVTSVQEVSTTNEAAIYRQLAADGKLKTRIYDCAGLKDWKTLADKKIERASGDAFVRIGCLKSFADGDAATFERLLRDIPLADKANLQVMIHAIGSEANSVILKIYERVLKENGAKDRRFRVEHAHGVRAEDWQRFGKTKIIASMQPFLFDGGVFGGTESYRTLLNTGAKIAFGSDTPIIETNPLKGIYAAIGGASEKMPEQALTVEEAVRAYTYGSAYAEFQENVKGTISIGKLADMIILSDDIFTIKKELIPKTRVLTTIVDGKIVYEEK